ncbi:MAG TPA: shikimate kinase [Termitinemataceae bacterium]|nr:shikimate kinase [Termitinemataceae bacterium]HOM24356.1 shikimate kinase [Termitinemataceae bacterium]HPQ01432.1 shikimate kinase [Termitinemataceae bacterium]
MTSKKQNIVIALVGPKHCGKTTLAWELAQRLSQDCYDTDDMITQLTGLSPRQLFQRSIEEFRAAEYEALKTILEKGKEGCIVATGGGIIDNPPAWELLQKKTTIVFLEVSAEEAWQRILTAQGSTGTLPPFLQTENPQETHRILHLRRNKTYAESAHYIIRDEGKSPQQKASEILKKMGLL